MIIVCPAPCQQCISPRSDSGRVSVSSGHEEKCEAELEHQEEEELEEEEEEELEAKTGFRPRTRAGLLRRQ